MTESAPAPAIPAWAIGAIVEAGRRMDSRNWVPGTAGNISARLGDGRIAITRSGVHKGFLDAGGVMLVDPHGNGLTPGMRPSAETLLHCQLYDVFPGVGAVLHGHSVAGTVLSMARPGAIRLAGYELLKAFGQATHDVALDLPVFDNDQDMARLAEVVAPALASLRLPAYLIRGHGVYVWGVDMPTALARLEALEFLLACELERERLP